MERIAFFLDNKNLPVRNFKSISDCNPGIAGSEYEFMLIPYLLQNRDNDITPYLLVNVNGDFPHEHVNQVDTLADCCIFCRKNNISKLVIDIKSYCKDVLDKNALGLSIIIWAHNTISYRLLDELYSLDYVKKIVNVGREQLELYRDHLATLKSTYIYNIFPSQEKDYYWSKIGNRDNHNVVYMGSLIESKGFHLLAKVWKDVLKSIPDAQLFVIGSGKLYDKDAVLGRYNIASPEYEKLFIPYIVDENGKILDSVHFLGILGEEKYDIMGKCKVGVPNPTGKSETFCICGLEMQLMGCNITTIEHPAYLDTILSKEWLFKKEKQLAQYLIKRLLSPNDDLCELYEFVSSNFGVESNIERWEYVLHNIGTPIIEPISKFHYQHKLLKDWLFNLKRRYPRFHMIPSVGRVCNLWIVIKKMIISL